MIRFETCEEYVLEQLADREEKIENLREENSRLLDEMCENKKIVDTLSRFLVLRRAADGRRVIDMRLIFEEFEPDEFKLLNEMLDLRMEGEG